MAHEVCVETRRWVDEVREPVERCLEQPCVWWCLCCNKWLCGLIWIVVTAAGWVIERTCEIVADTVDVVVGVVTGIVNIVAGVVTGDWSRVVGGLLQIVVPIVKLAIRLTTIATLGSVVGAFTHAADRWSLKDHARTLLDARFRDNPALAEAAKAAVGTEGQGFGLRLRAVAQRLSIRSDARSQPDGPPDLIRFIDETRIDLAMLAGLRNQPLWWQRNFPELVGDAGPLTAADIDAYVAQRGVGPDVKHFTLSSMSRDALQSRLSVANTHAGELGLRLQWTIVDVAPTSADQIVIDESKFARLLPAPPFGRIRKADNAAGATSDLCMPLVIASFGFLSPGVSGISALKESSVCVEPSADGSNALRGEGITGAAFRFRQPDIVFKYTAIHELGHSFGLCHCDGLFRIMYTAATDQKKSIWSWSALYQLWTDGPEAAFIGAEGKAAWDYIVANFASECLTTRPF